MRFARFFQGPDFSHRNPVALFLKALQDAFKRLLDDPSTLFGVKILQEVHSEYSLVGHGKANRSQKRRLKQVEKRARVWICEAR